MEQAHFHNRKQILALSLYTPEKLLARKIFQVHHFFRVPRKYPPSYAQQA